MRDRCHSKVTSAGGGVGVATGTKVAAGWDLLHEITWGDFKNLSVSDQLISISGGPLDTSGFQSSPRDCNRQPEL